MLMNAQIWRLHCPLTCPRMSHIVYFMTESFPRCLSVALRPAELGSVSDGGPFLLLFFPYPLNSG